MIKIMKQKSQINVEILKLFPFCLNEVKYLNDEDEDEEDECGDFYVSLVSLSQLNKIQNAAIKM